ncbi:hypothetical protein [Lentibacillus sp. JNUCC-1]|uniref:hypothetical protein n=1 Tax=Lentibacillus sp. JNUCC-1 TaxID=2654513 RepID=UPI001E54F48E|nr:hypothetical protein [Lentibacillus sp. JNUCC-1]
MRLLYNVMAEPTSTNSDLDNLKVAILDPNISYPLQQTMRTFLQQLKTRLGTAFQHEYTVPPYFAEAAQIWQEIMSIDWGDSVKRAAFTQDTQTALGTLIKEKLTHSTDHHPYLTWALVGARLFKPSSQRQLEIKKVIKQGTRCFMITLKIVS